MGVLRFKRWCRAEPCNSLLGDYIIVVINLNMFSFEFDCRFEGPLLGWYSSKFTQILSSDDEEAHMFMYMPLALRLLK